MAAPRVEFHVLGEAAPSARLRVAARLVAAAWREEGPVLVSFDAAGELAEFDTLLWTFEDGSFVPHEPWDGRDAPPAPVALVSGALPDRLSRFARLVNLGTLCVPDVDPPARVDEIIDADETRRRAGRERFRRYRERGWPINTQDASHG